MVLLVIWSWSSDESYALFVEWLNDSIKLYFNLNIYSPALNYIYQLGNDCNWRWYALYSHSGAHNGAYNAARNASKSFPTAYLLLCINL